MTPLAVQALEFIENRSWSMVPSSDSKPKPKAPCVKWTPWQSALPTATDLRKWDARFHPERWGVVTGELSGVIGVDFDGEAGRVWMDKWKLTPHVRTPSGGYHVYFSHPGWLVPTLNAKASKDMWPFPGVDVRGDGGFIVLLGGTATGKYEITRTLDPYPFDAMPRELGNFLRDHSKSFNSDKAPEDLPDEDDEPDDLPVQSVESAAPSPFEVNNISHTNGKRSAGWDCADAVSRALGIAVSDGRNNAGMWLACQLRDNRVSKGDARGWMLDYQARCPSTNLHGEREPYSKAEASATLDSSYNSPPRDAWTAPRTAKHANGHATAHAPMLAVDAQSASLASHVTDPAPNYREAVVKAIAAAVDANDPAQCWNDNLISAIARVSNFSYQYDAIRVFKSRYPKDFPGNIRGWIERIKERREEFRLEYVARDASPYIVNDKGALIGNVANAITMIREIPLAYNLFSCTPFLTSKSPWGSEGTWTDYDDIKCAEWFQRRSLNVGTAIASEAANAASRDNPVHPVRDYLHSLSWDGTERLDNWLTLYMGCADNNYVKGVAAKWMISACARVFEPGCQADYTLVLEGDQGKRKSSALRVLGGIWFTDDIADIGTKDSAMQLQGKWIIELAELDAFRRAQMTTIKSWLVRREDHFRPPYGRRSEDFPRQNVFAASTNKDDWGQDDTGLRRFWPVLTGKINAAGLAEVRDQLWAEAFSRYLKKEQYWMNEQAEDAAQLEQADRQDVDAWRDTVEAWLESDPSPRHVKDQLDIPLQSYPPDRVFVSDVLWHCLEVQKKDWNQVNKNRVSKILRLAGYMKERTPRKEAVEGKRPEYWTKIKKTA